MESGIHQDLFWGVVKDLAWGWANMIQRNHPRTTCIIGSDLWIQGNLGGLIWGNQSTRDKSAPEVGSSWSLGLQLPQISHLESPQIEASKAMILVVQRGRHRCRVLEQGYVSYPPPNRCNIWHSHSWLCWRVARNWTWKSWLSKRSHVKILRIQKGCPKNFLLKA